MIRRPLTYGIAALCLAVTACEKAPVVQSIDFFVENGSVRKETLASCNAMSGRSDSDGNCVNARLAEDKAFFKRSADARVIVPGPLPDIAPKK